MPKSLINTVVVGLDFSKMSRLAVRQALALKTMMNAEIVFAHIGYLPESAQALIDGKVRKQVKAGLKKEVSKYYDLSHLPNFEVELSWGNGAQELIKIAKKYSNPMIVIGKSGRNTLGRLFLGSTAEQLALTSPYPVFIQQHQKIQAPRSAVVGVDLSKNSKVLIKWAHEFGREYRIPIEGLYCSPPTVPVLDYVTYEQIHEEAEKMRKAEFSKLQKIEPGIKFSFRSGSPVAALLKASKESDLLILSPHNRPKLFPAFGSVSAKVVRQATSNILIVPSR